MKTATILMLGLTCTLAACSVDEPPPSAPAAAQPATPLPNSNVFSTDVKALQKAKDVQKTVDQQKADTDKALQDAGG
jgi:hypothetical protein